MNRAELWGRLSKTALEKKKAETPSPWISNCLSREVSLCTLLGFREKKNRGRGYAGTWREGAEGQLGEVGELGHVANGLGQGQSSAQRCG